MKFSYFSGVKYDIYHLPHETNPIWIYMLKVYNKDYVFFVDLEIAQHINLVFLLLI